MSYFHIAHIDKLFAMTFQVCSESDYGRSNTKNNIHNIDV